MAETKNPHAVALGRLGGLATVKKGAAMLSPEERAAKARKAALARWTAKKAVDSAERLEHTDTVHERKRER